MLEIEPLVQGAVEAGVSALRAARLRIGGPIFRVCPRIGNSLQPRRLFTSHLESHRCRFLAETSLESYSCKKMGGYPLAPAFPVPFLPFGLNARKLSTYARFKAKPRKIRSCRIFGVKPSLESAVPKRKWVRCLHEIKSRGISGGLCASLKQHPW